jgi:hypothetical protein
LAGRSFVVPRRLAGCFVVRKLDQLAMPSRFGSGKQQVSAASQQSEVGMLSSSVSLFGGSNQAFFGIVVENDRSWHARTKPNRETFFRNGPISLMNQNQSCMMSYMLKQHPVPRPDATRDNLTQTRTLGMW